MNVFLVSLIIAIVLIITFIFVFTVFPSHVDLVNSHLDDFTSAGCSLPSEIKRTFPELTTTIEMGDVIETHYRYIVKDSKKNRIAFINVGPDSAAYMGVYESEIDSQISDIRGVKTLSHKIHPNEEIRLIVVDRNNKRPTVYIGELK